MGESHMGIYGRMKRNPTIVFAFVVDCSLKSWVIEGLIHSLHFRGPKAFHTIITTFGASSSRNHHCAKFSGPKWSCIALEPGTGAKGDDSCAIGSALPVHIAQLFQQPLEQGWFRSMDR
ncbi:hypothetical protein Hypma_011302 [Hypsizygus marmoreus]|uniref:Uncharacterized protein n=1 Tax=Hypsizygus marmoreus TaxID=39966 RepID=A0A369JQJ8_HYPMA|nr:hypothetical protein Hypma_011302 [Hypsizygus marmoreus]